MNRQSKQRRYTERAQSREKQVRKKPQNNSASGERFSGRPASKNPERHDDVFYTGEKSAHHGWMKYRESAIASLPSRLPIASGKRLVQVYVEGYEDVSFWRGIFDDFEDDGLIFEISVPPREDLAKGKKVIMSMIPECSPYKLLCVDSDFDYLFDHGTDQSKVINNSQYLFHTYAYATENFLCYAPSLHNVCVKATKNDTRIFDFERFMTEYSEAIYPLFIWYAYSAQLKNENVFTLLEFKSSVKLNYLEVENNGEATIGWLKRQVAKRLQILERNNPSWEEKLAGFERKLAGRGLTPQNTYLFMQGHTLMDNVVMIMLNAVCEQLKLMTNIKINSSTKTGVALRNELSNYNNALRNVRDILLDNEAYKDCELYIKLQNDIQRHVDSLKKEIRK